MAAGKWKVYDQAKVYLANGTHDLDDATNWKIALFTSTSNCNTLSVGTATYGDLTNEVANGNGYTTGGASLASETYSQTSGTATFTSGTGSWTASGGSIVARYAVIYRNATVNSIVKPLLCVCLLDTTPADVTTTSGNSLTITMNASGIFTISGATTD